MNYKKKYEDALKKAKDLHDNHALGMPFIYQTCEQIFPELKESEDEKIRKEMIFYFQEEIPQCSIQEHADKMKEFIAWLEKQGEQKSIDLNTISIQKLVGVYRNTDEYDEDGNLKGKPVNCMIRAYEQGIRDILKTIKQKDVKPAWSEEDEETLDYIIDYIENNKSHDKIYTKKTEILEGMIDWLKSLKERMKIDKKS